MRDLYFLLVNIMISSKTICTVLSKGTGDKCGVQEIFNDVTMLGGIKAGLYIPYQGEEELVQMTATKCTEYCCKKAGAVVDVVFLINNYCYCVSCYSLKLCQPVAIKPPRGFSPVAIILNKDILHLIRPSSVVKSSTTPPTTPGPNTTSITTTTTTTTTTKYVSSTPTNKPITTNHVWYGSTRVRRTDGQEGGGWQTTTYQALPHTPLPTTLRKTLHPTRIAEKLLKVEGRGNKDITLRCKGQFLVTKVAAFGVPGNQKAVEDFNEYCQANMLKEGDDNVCHVSLKRIYKSTYPLFVVTKVTYNCKYVTRDPP